MKNLKAPLLDKVNGQFFLFVLWGVHSFLESIVYFSDMQKTLEGRYTDGSLGDFLVYHTGDFNNSLIVMFVLDCIFSYVIKETVIRLAITAVLTGLIFIIIEFNNIPDIPAALAGILLYLILGPE